MTNHDINNALFALFMIGVVFLFACAIAYTFGEKKLGTIFAAAGAVHMLPAMTKLWMTVIFG